MSTVQNNSFCSEYEETFYIIPRRIRKLPGITLAFLDVYETIFQFWNKGNSCYLSNAGIQKRTGLGHTQVNQALIFFETHGELVRKIYKGLRYLVQPRRSVETDFIEDDPTAGAVPPPTAGAVPEIKNKLMYEYATTISDSSSSIDFDDYKQNELAALQAAADNSDRKAKADEFRKESLADEKCKAVYAQRFKGLNVTLEELYQDCVDYWSQKNQMVYKARFLTHLKKAPLENYKDLSAPESHPVHPSKKILSEADNELLADYKAWLKYQDKQITALSDWIKSPEKRQRALDLYQAEKAACTK